MRVADGDWRVALILPDGSEEVRPMRAAGGVLDIVTPEGNWQWAALTIRREGAPSPAPVPRLKPAPPRPVVEHIPPRSVTAGKPLGLSLRITPSSRAAVVRLHYRQLRQSANFKTLEAPARRPVFTIPAEDLSPAWDLLYYFEILPEAAPGWFHPDPGKATPYYVLEVTAP